MLTRGGGVGNSRYKLLGAAGFSDNRSQCVIEAHFGLNETESSDSKYEKEVPARDGTPNKGFCQPIKHQIDEPIRHSQKETSQFERSLRIFHDSAHLLFPSHFVLAEGGAIIEVFNNDLSSDAPTDHRNGDASTV